MTTQRGKVLGKEKWMQREGHSAEVNTPAAERTVMN